MRVFTVLALLLAMVAMVFALQNATVVSISFFSWQASQSMALVLLFSFFLGVVAGLLLSVPPMIRRMGRLAQTRRTVTEQAEELERLQRQLAEPAPGLAGGAAFPQDVPPL
ncbi:lipopolysaccharide assembly LapA domain-containing protein [Synechococcus sp. CCY 9618]|uniref:LapA family protein n=1 Tax=Synechococcus sp. CCY 9618 TaxID=2815602 RepID=UPI001C21A8C0|nr:LapA family protein [Synechococcus sp. CCY 9618]